MGTLFLVRHGQASFGAANYDQLSPLGHQQCVRLGQYFAERGVRFDGVLRGSLKRHEQSLNGLLEGLNQSDAPTPSVWPALNEYDSAAVLKTVHSGELKAPHSKEAYRDHFRLLRQGLTRWTTGAAMPEGMPSFKEFQAGIVAALDHVRAAHQGNVLLVSSGGPISTAVTYVLGAPSEVLIDLNMRIRNSAVTEFSFTPKRHQLHTFNTLAHLDGEAWAKWVTYT
jgi:broad specificity phosphatase PhoE